MRNIFAIAGKELRSLFVSPIAYVVLTGFLLIASFLFVSLLSRFVTVVNFYASLQNAEAMQQFNLNEQVLAVLLGNFTFILIILVPLITMRAFAEERRAGTYELLLTSPLSVVEIVIGKLLGLLGFVVIMVALTGVYPVILLFYGNPELGPILTGYLGLFLLAAVFVAVGLLASALTDNQIVAAVVCFVVLLLLYIISWPAETVGGAAGDFLKYLSVVDHYGEMIKGVVDTKDIVYFVTLILVGLFLTHRAVEASRQAQ
jgi:gliding motility-associated transport system permease protein